MLLRYASLLSLLLLLSSASAVDVGSPAPALEGITLIKGEHRPLDAGLVSVVELWATWCPPCRTTIPHLTQLQREHGERLQIIGISEEPVDTIRPFVEKMGAKMEYVVAAAPAALYARYNEGVRGIPFAYIVDGQGIVRWKGHPMEMDEPLAQIIDGSFDDDRAAAISAASAALQASFASNDPATIGAANEKLLALDPLHAMGLNVGIRLAEITEDKQAFQALFTRVPAADLSPAQASSLLNTLLSHSELTWIDPVQVQQLSQRSQDPSSNHAAGLLAAARAAYFLGRLDQAVDLARQASEAQVQGAGDFLSFIEAIQAVE